jgi:F-type H+-transporting ATPase subunit delta
MKSNKNNTVNNYAEGLVSAAIEVEAVTSLQQDINNLQTLLENSPEFASVIKIPFFMEYLDKVFEEITAKYQLSKYTANFLKLLLKNRRLAYLADILSVCEDLILEHNGFTKVELTTADALDEHYTNAIKEILEESLKTKVLIKHIINSKIIAGIIIRVGSKVLDDSIKNKIDMLQTKIQYAIE